MDQNHILHNLKTVPMFEKAMQKLTIAPETLDNDEVLYLLTSAVILLRKYQVDRRFTSFVELSYYIVLKYSLTFSDFRPLYDVAIAMGFYPICQAITAAGLIQFNDISSALLHNRISENYDKAGIVETYDQKKAREAIFDEKNTAVCYVAPTSFGKSELILDHIEANWTELKKVAIIVPTKSLLMQTYRSIRNRGLPVKIILHDEMYTGQDRFIGVLTQERALRLLDKSLDSFDVLYIDEAHRMLEREPRAMLLTRLVRLNQSRNQDSKVLYLSPLVEDANNLSISEACTVAMHRIPFSMKEAEYYEYKSSGEIYKYNRFIDEFLKIGVASSLFDYIIQNSTNKTFCYLYAPRKIEEFAIEFSCRLPEVVDSQIDEIINALKQYVDEDFLVISALKKGLIYLHGKMPEIIKDYLESKFSEIEGIRFLVANKVILEGINLPIDSLFILNARNLQGKDLTNLIGRVNRLGYIFASPTKLERLMPPVHFVNSDKYNMVNGNLERKIRLLRSSVFKDKVKNPVLANFDTEAAIKDRVVEKCQKLVENEEVFFTDQKSPDKKLKQRMIALGMNSIYELSDEFCHVLLLKINKIKSQHTLKDTHFLERLQMVFINDVEEYILDHEFLRLSNNKAISYYKKYYRDRKKSLKEQIQSEIAYYYRRINEGDFLMYIGESFGEEAYPVVGNDAHRKVYLNLRGKTRAELANIAIIKQKLEEDFTSFKLRMFFQLMVEYDLLTQEEYQEIVFGTTDPKKIELSKLGLSLRLVSRLDEDSQLSNIGFDENGNIYTNEVFEEYRSSADDFYRFELDRYI